ncbi:unnamed protein product, partial [Medioppia subpectinata]
ANSWYLLNVAESQIQQKLHPEIESAINNITSSEFMAFYFYEQLAWHFNRDSVSLPGFHTFFKKRACGLRRIARKFMEYQNKRGGRVILTDIQTYPKQDGWTPLEALAKTILVETGITQALTKQNALADSVIDLKELSDHVTQLQRAGPGIGEYLYDKDSINNGSYFDHVNRDNY